MKARFLFLTLLGLLCLPLGGQQGEGPNGHPVRILPYDEPASWLATPFTFEATDGEQPYTWTVTTDNGDYDQTGDGSTIEFHLPGTYTIRVTDANGTFDEIIVEIPLVAEIPRLPSDFNLDEKYGSKHRKIGLNGRPLSDEKPQAKAESDVEPEETFIDAITLHLNHSTTDFYIPIQGSDLALEVRSSVKYDVWNVRGISPARAADAPFGPAWRAESLAPTIKKWAQSSIFHVTDEQGVSYEFHNLVGSTFFAIPARSGKETVTATLTIQDARFVLTKRNGTQVTFAANSFGVQSPKEFIRYYRVESVQDLNGYRLQYSYSNDDTVIPSRIQVVYPNGSNGPFLDIVQEDGLVTEITDPLNRTVSYSYQPELGEHFLTSVTHNTAVTSYGYSNRTVRVEGETMHHAVISLIKDPLMHSTRFDWKFPEHIFNYSDTLPLFANPDRRFRGTQMIKKVTLPDTSIVTFEHFAKQWPLFSNIFDQDEEDPIEDGINLVFRRYTQVTDPEGNSLVYAFDKCVSLGYHLAAQDFQSTVIFYTRQTIQHFKGHNLDRIIEGNALNFVPSDPSTVLLGYEQFEFNPKANMAPVSVRDFSGNITTFAYEDQWDESARFFGLILYLSNDAANHLIPFYEDPTRQTDALNQSKSFEYEGPFRMMSKITDEENRTTDYEFDSMGRRTKETIKDPSGIIIQETLFAYNTIFPGFLKRKTVKKLGSSDPSWASDLVTEYVPDSQGRVWKEIVDPDGLALTTTHTYDAVNNKVSTSDPRGHTTTFEYDHRNRLKKVFFPDQSYKEMAYDLRGNRVLEKDENGNYKIYEYDSRNRIARTASDLNGNKVIDSSDLITEFSYHPVGSKASQTDPNGGVSTFTYDALQRLVATTTPLGHTTTLEYGANSGGSVFDTAAFKPTKSTDPRGYVTEVTYDALYRPVTTSTQYQISPAASATTTTVYDAVGNPIRVTDPLGRVTETDFDHLNRPIIVRHAVSSPGVTNSIYGYAQTFYTSTGLTWKVRDELGRFTETEYDRAGRPTKVKSPAAYDFNSQTTQSSVTQTLYDAAGNVVATINPLGQRWDFTYDSRNRKIQELQPAVPDADNGGTPTRPMLSVTYDLVGNVIAQTDARGNTSHTLYDRANRPSHSITPSAQVRRPNDTTATLHTVMRMIYDRNGNALQTIRGSLAASSTLLNAPDPYAVSLTDSLITVENSYDALNRLITTAQDPQGLNIIVTNEYDPAGNKTAVIDGKNQRTEFTYDGLNRNLSIKDPANESVRFLYDSINKVQRTDSLNQVTHYEYDARNRLAVVSYASSSPQNSDRIYNYDKVGNLLAVTKPAKGGLADVAYSYDSLNRPASETSSGQTHTYRYDLAGNRRQTTYGGTGRVLNSAYDALNRLTTLTEIVPAGSNRISQYHYDLSGNVRLRILPNSDVSLSHYDALNRQETRITARPDQSILHAYHYQYDLVGNVRFIDEEYPQNGLDNRTVLNSYDPVDRLISETITTASGAITTTYTFDNAHNRTQKATGSPGVPPTSEINYTYNNLNQMTSWTDGTKTVSHLYDRNGNQTLLSNGQYHWFRAFDFENRLIITRKGIDLHQPFEEYSYTYDYRTRRVVRDETMAGGVKTRLVFSGGTSVQEYTVNGTSETLAVEYIRGTDWGGGVGGILYTLRDSTPSFTHFNNRGDVVAKTDATGSLTYQAQYEAFGTRTAESGTTEDRQKANTKDEDPTGLLNEGFRYRDLETGTFITRDPLGFVDGPNMYAYVVQNPWTAFDPLGLQTGRKYTPAQLAAKRAQRERQAQAFKEYGGWKQVGSTGADFVPFVGTGKGGYETFTGKDPVTGKSLSGGERVVAGIGTVASVIPGGKLVVKGIGKAIAKGGDEAAGAVTTSARATQESTENMVDVYRSVGPAELADIDATRKFRVPEGGAEGKYFSTSQESVENYARDAEKAFGDPPYSTVKSQAPESAFTADSVSNIITDAPEAVVIPQKTLDRMVPEVIKRAEEPK